MLHWLQWLVHERFAGQHTVLVNIDETPIVPEMPARKGHLIVNSADEHIHWSSFGKTSAGRKHATLLACIVNDAGLQKHMPQILLVKDKATSRADKVRLKALPKPMIWYENTDGWITADNLCPLLTLIRRIVRGYRPHSKIVIIMDTAPPHIAQKVLTHLNRLGVHILLIPAGMTWLLQPLDSHVFNSVKKELFLQLSTFRAGLPEGKMPSGAWIDILGNVVQKMLVNTEWSTTFASNGLSADLSDLRSRIQEIAGQCFPALNRPPEREELEVLLGRVRHNFRQQVLRHTLRAEAVAALAPPFVPAEVAPDLIPRGRRLLPARLAAKAKAKAAARGEHASASASSAHDDGPPKRLRSGRLY